VEDGGDPLAGGEARYVAAGFDDFAGAVGS